MTKKVLIDLEDVYVLKGKCDLNSSLEYFSRKGAPSLNMKELELFREGCGYFADLLFGFISGQPEVQDEKSPAASQWVSVEEELPDDYYGRLWIRLRDSTVTLDVSYDDSRGFIGPFVDYSPRSGEVTHWMPIPPLPEKNILKGISSEDCPAEFNKIFAETDIKDLLA